MKKWIVDRSRSLLVAGAVASAVVAAVAMTPAKGAPAAKAKLVVVGQLVLGGETSPVTAYSWEVTALSSFTQGGGASVGKPNPSAIRFTKLIDAGSIQTLLNIANGTAFPSAVFTVTVGKGNSAGTMVYEMENLFVTRLSTSAADGLVTEEVSLIFKVVRWTFTSADGEVTTGTWDVVSGAAS
jgi:type VI protein secretion system component Hcp